MISRRLANPRSLSMLRSRLPHSLRSPQLVHVRAPHGRRDHFQLRHAHSKLTKRHFSQTRTMPSQQQEQYLADTKAPICQLEVKSHFDQLSDTEQKYAHHLSRASHWGYRAVLRSVSLESEDVYDMILSIHSAVSGDYAKLAKDTGVSDEDVALYMEYAAQFLTNAGNYKSFGDVKFIPRVSEEAFAKISKIDPKAAALYDTVKGPIYSTTPEALNLLGYPDAGHMSTYYSSNITKDDIESVQKVLEDNGILPENTRLFKNDNGFVLKIASANVAANGEFKSEYDVNGTKMVMEYGDHAQEFKEIVRELTEAKKYASSSQQSQMLEHYIKHFENGSMDQFIKSQEEWVQDMGPTVETNIGFIESYRDPKGVRAEWEGFVAIVNKEQTEKFAELVNSAEKYIPLLPWNSEFEKPKFRAPLFTSIEVMTFAGSGIPAGINLPNSDSVRLNVGFKNVSLGNVLAAPSSLPVTFLAEEDATLFEKYRGPSFEVQVGIHELLGHGSGKLLSENNDGTFNFDNENLPISPVTGKPITTWYKKGQTWGSVFGAIAGSYEECRAESVAMHLSTDRSLLKIFGHEGQEADDVLYVGWLQMARAGLVGLEFWDPKSGKWGQAHMQARYAILQCFLQAGEGFVTLESSKPDYSDLVVKLDRSKIETVGKKAVSDFLQKLHIYKATADIESGQKFYDEMTNVDQTMAKYRDAVMAAKQPRKQFVQCNSSIENDKVVFTEYETSPLGVIKSFYERGV